MDFKNDIPISAILYVAMKDAGYISSTGKTKFVKRLYENIFIYTVEMRKSK